MTFIQHVSLTLIALMLAGCAQTATLPDTTPEVPGTPERQVSCSSDDDCVPDPSQCHPRTCVLKAEAEGVEKPEICTTLYDLQAAYNPEDCTCDSGVCTNKNLGRTSEPPAE